MKRISVLGAVLVALTFGGFGAAAPARADGFYNQGLQPPPYKYRSQYARKGGMYLNLGNVAYVRVPTIRLRVGAVKFREVNAANSIGVGHFVTGVGHFRTGPARYGKQVQVAVPIRTPYYYKPYGGGAPFYGAPGGYVANYYGRPGYGIPGRLQGEQLGYGTYGFNAGAAFQQLPGAQQPAAQRGSFNAPNPIVAAPPQQPRPGFAPRFVHFNGATVKSGQLPTVHKPMGKHFIRVE